VFDECGDGLLYGGASKNEYCDDNNNDDGDGCSSNCKVENGYICVDSGANTLSVCTFVPVCGNGKKEDGEECDDGNADDGDGCDSLFCAVEDGWTCTEADANSASVCTLDNVCGDGKRME
jgi:cysteine-rich repeat protein